MTTRSERIRLACELCGRDDFDGIDSIPDDWTDVEEYQTYEESIEEVHEDDPDPGKSVLDWFTHIGTCPECSREE